MAPLYLDSCVIIYLLEGAEPFHSAVRDRLREHAMAPDPGLVTSRLARLECRILPLREGNHDLLNSYDDFFGAEGLALIELSARVIERATAIRASYGFRTPDALHLATAVEAGATTFLTNDGRLGRFEELPVVVLGVEDGGG